MTCITKRFQIRRIESQLREFVVVLHMVNCRSLSETSVPFALNTKILVSPENRLAHRFPLPCLTEFQFSHCSHLPFITEKEKGGKLGLAAGKAVDALHLYSVAFLILIITYIK